MIIHQKAVWSMVLQVFVLPSQEINETRKSVNHPVVIICHETTFHVPVSIMAGFSKFLWNFHKIRISNFHFIF